jgi:hypothetical protein
MSPIQQMLLGVGGAKTTYLDDVFNTDVYEGTGSTRSLVNGINLAGKGGAVWVKNREANDNNWLFADAIGVGTGMRVNSTGAAWGFGNPGMTSFNSNGFTVGTHDGVNADDEKLVAWSFRKAKGFFTTCTWTGNATNRTISHDLGCIPGMIWIKRRDVATDWMVYHRSLNGSNTPSANRLHLNTTVGEAAASTVFNDTEPTSTTFGLGTHYDVNGNNGTFIAYLFAGGEANLASVSGARCVVFDGGSDGNSDYLEIPNSSDFSFGSGDFTVEGWFNLNSTSSAQSIIGVWDYENSQRSWLIEANNAGGLAFLASPNGSSSTDTIGSNCVYPGQWTHFAAVRNGNTLRLFVNGTQVATNSFTGSLYDNTNDKCYIGILNGSPNPVAGKLSNIRVVKGTAVYTSSFRPPTAPLTNITNTKLLCCNHENRDGSTVTPDTITAEGNPVARYFSPFDDPAGFVFGDNEEGIVKVGSYIGNGSTTGPEVFLGHEPQWLMIKRIDTGETWDIYDSMRGIVTGGNDQTLRSDSSASEYGYDRLSLTPTGFQAMNDNNHTNADGGTYIYLSIRRPDAYVGKPPELGTDVFNVVLGNSDGSPVIPVFAANFPVDFALRRRKDVVDDTDASARLTKGKRLKTNLTDAESSSASAVFDSNVGWNDGDFDDRYPSWMWKRHAGFDVVCWEGDDTNAFRSHSLGKTPEMIWFKNRDDTRSWRVFHKGLNGGTNPEDYAVSLNASSAEGSNTSYMNGTAPTSTHFVAGLDGDTNVTGDSYIAMLFASVSGISKVGSFVGSDSDQTITLGFQPRFLIVKAYNQAYSWLVLDSTRGWATSSGNNSKYLFLELNWAQDDIDVGYLTSTGFVAKGGSGNINDAGASYIYYAHA